jgi:hypothetical protein
LWLLTSWSRIQLWSEEVSSLSKEWFCACRTSHKQGFAVKVRTTASRDGLQQDGNPIVTATKDGDHARKSALPSTKRICLFCGWESPTEVDSRPDDCKVVFGHGSGRSVRDLAKKIQPLGKKVLGVFWSKSDQIQAEQGRLMETTIRSSHQKKTITVVSTKPGRPSSEVDLSESTSDAGRRRYAEDRLKRAQALLDVSTGAKVVVEELAT